MLIIRMLNFIDAASGIVTLSQWQYGAQVERVEFSLNLCTGRSLTERLITDPAASIQFNLLMMSI